jgi:hypothetical protein
VVSRPPGIIRANHPVDQAEPSRQGHGEEGPSPSIRVVTRSIREALIRAGEPVPAGAALRRLVSTFLRTGRPVDEAEAWVLTYADPTGEAAVRHAMNSPRR